MKHNYGRTSLELRFKRGTPFPFHFAQTLHPYASIPVSGRTLQLDIPCIAITMSLDGLPASSTVRFSVLWEEQIAELCTTCLDVCQPNVTYSNSFNETQLTSHVKHS